MSKLSSWWHNFVDGLSVSTGTKLWLHSYGLYVIWGVGIVAGLLVLRAMFF